MWEQRRHRCALAAGMLAASLCGRSTCAAAQTHPKHILFLMIDDLGYNDVSYRTISGKSSIRSRLLSVSLCLSRSLARSLALPLDLCMHWLGQGTLQTSARPTLTGWRWPDCAWSGAHSLHSISLHLQYSVGILHRFGCCFPKGLCGIVSSLTLSLCLSLSPSGTTHTTSAPRPAPAFSLGGMLPHCQCRAV